MDESQRRQVAARVAEARKARGWSQARLAQEAGVAENTVVSIEGGKRNTQGEKLRAVLDVLELAQPIDGSLDLEGVPEDFRIFFKVAAQRAKVLSDADRARVLAKMYPELLMVTDE